MKKKMAAGHSKPQLASKSAKSPYNTSPYGPSSSAPSSSSSASLLTSKSRGRVVDAGGGAGHSHLQFSVLQSGQQQMFERSVYVLPPLLQLNKEQEIRQVSLVEPTHTLHVTVAREDYLDVETQITLTYQASSSQAAWRRFVQQVQNDLKIDFLEVIVDRSGLAQVHCTLSLREGTVRIILVSVGFFL
jgi:hypothetical protein